MGDDNISIKAEVMDRIPLPPAEILSVLARFHFYGFERRSDSTLGEWHRLPGTYDWPPPPLSSLSLGDIKNIVAFSLIYCGTLKGSSVAIFDRNVMMVSAVTSFLVGPTPKNVNFDLGLVLFKELDEILIPYVGIVLDQLTLPDSIDEETLALL